MSIVHSFLLYMFISGSDGLLGHSVFVLVADFSTFVTVITGVCRAHCWRQDGKALLGLLR
jgi:hypothetical protein